VAGPPAPAIFDEPQLRLVNEKPNSTVFQESAAVENTFQFKVCANDAGLQMFLKHVLNKEHTKDILQTAR